MSKVSTALDLFSKGYNCAQAIVAAYGPDYGLTREQCITVSSGFGGGLGRQGQTCGAIVGALMVLSLRFGRITITQPERKAEVYEHMQDFTQRFTSIHRSICCRELLGCDLSTSEGRQQAKEGNYHLTMCVDFVRDAAEILDDMCG